MDILKPICGIMTIITVLIALLTIRIRITIITDDDEYDDLEQIENDAGVDFGELAPFVRAGWGEALRDD